MGLLQGDCFILPSPRQCLPPSPAASRQPVWAPSKNTVCWVYSHWSIVHLYTSKFVKPMDWCTCKALCSVYNYYCVVVLFPVAGLAWLLRSHLAKIQRALLRWVGILLASSRRRKSIVLITTSAKRWSRTYCSSGEWTVYVVSIT